MYIILFLDPHARYKVDHDRSSLLDRLVNCPHDLRSISANHGNAEIMFSSSSYDNTVSHIVKRHAIPSKPVMQICRCAERSACIVQRDGTVTIIRRREACALDAERITSREMNQACCILFCTDCRIPTLRSVVAA